MSEVPDSDVTIIENLFDKESYSRILDFINYDIKFYPLSIDDKEFIRKYAHNVPFFVDIHKQLTDIASFYFKEKVKPSYCFLSMYEKNGICPLHIDRPQCRYTIDYLINSTETEPWPIHIGKVMTDGQRTNIIQSGMSHIRSEELMNARIAKESFTTVNLQPNSAVLYSGTHQWHYRSQRLKNTANLVFFHFVPEDFDGQLD